MSRWTNKVAAMDAAIFNEFGDTAVINGNSVEVIKDDELDQFDAMAGNNIRLAVSQASNISVKKGDAVTYNDKDYRVVDVPDKSDGLIRFYIR
jgi:translation elongation factor EF-1alpha